MSTHEIQIPRHRLTVDEYYRMAELGILAPDARVELIEGEIIDMTPQGSRHAAILSRLNERIVKAVGSSAIVRCQQPIRLGNRSEPEPDFAIVRSDPSYYARAHPVASDVLLLIEVSHTSVKYDRYVKAPLYARHGIVEVWVIDIEAARVLIFRVPRDGNYADASSVDRPDALTPVALPLVRIDLSEIF
jgi:Uma2 family endonuclease